MSSGSFVISRYAADYLPGTAIHPVRVQPETQLLSITIAGNPVANTPPAGAVTNPISAAVSKGRRAVGLSPAKVTIRFTATPPSGYSTTGRITLPLLNKPIRAATKGSTGTYLGVACEVVSVSPEKIT